MSHLTNEQLSALADGALEGAARATVDRHLEGCAACREALALLAAQDDALRTTLEHDPGEAYFESFAARVGGRIRAASLSGAQAKVHHEGRSLADWFRSPRKVALVAAVATVVAGAGIVILATREVRVPALRERELESRPAQETPVVPPLAVAPATPSAPPARAKGTAGPPAGAPQGVAPSRGEDRAAPATGGPATPNRLQEVRRNQWGEDVPVQRPGEFVYRPPEPPRTPAAPGEVVRVPKPRYAEPLEAKKRAEAVRGGVQQAPAGEGSPAAPASDLAAQGAPAGTAAAPRPEQTSSPRAELAAPGEQAAVAKEELARAGRACGTVLDEAGRPIAGAQVVNRTTGASVTTAADGSFCLEARGRSQEITVMAVGFKPVWRSVTAGEPARVALVAVPVLGAPKAEGGLGFTKSGQALQVRGTPDAFDHLPTRVRSLAKNAQRLTGLAEKVGVPSAWDSAAAEWERVLEGVQGGPLESETRYQVARARVTAWRGGATGKREAHAREALGAFLAHAPKGPERDQAEGWRRELGK